MKIITIEDIIDVYSKGKQKGWSFVLSKFNSNGITRTKSSFNRETFDNSDW